LPRRRPLHGDARFASRREIAAADLLSGDGVILGQVGGLGRFGARYLVLPGQQGVSLSAQPRAGKGVGVVIPNLLSWRGSAVVVDIKKENWTLTAGYRARELKQRTVLFDPLSPTGRTARWNPLDYVAESPHQRISDLQLIANMFFPDPPNTDPFWMSSARSLFLGIALYLCATPSLPRTIGETLRQGMASDEEGFSQHWRRVIQGRMSGRFPLPEQCVRALYDVIDLAPQTASSIRKTFTSKLELWANPVLDAATAASDFDLRTLRREPTSIYLGVNPKDLHRLQPLMSLFFQQAIAVQCDELPEHNLALAHQVLMLLDEFPALGRIPIIAEASGFLPGYNVRTLMVMQTPAQLREIYGENGAKVLLKTLAGRIYFAPKDMDEAEEISRELGFTTVKVRTLSKPVFDFAASRGRRSRSVNVSEQKRPLMLPQEVRDLGTRREIVFVEGVPPILCRKIRYYQLPVLRRRVLPPPEVPAIEPLPPRRDEENVVASPAPHAASRTPATREATLEDIEHLEKLTLEDFAAPLAEVAIPEKAPGERLTHEELQSAVDSFLSTLQQR
jgi:type IV secretion system protein VirD4